MWEEHGILENLPLNPRRIYKINEVITWNCDAKPKKNRAGIIEKNETRCWHARKENSDGEPLKQIITEQPGEI